MHCLRDLGNLNHPNVKEYSKMKKNPKITKKMKNQKENEKFEKKN